MTPVTTQCCIAGGGPAGMMLGFLLARQGIDVWVLEKHADFLRDFRGDTIHPSTLEVMHKLDLLEELLRRPHQKTERLTGFIGQAQVVLADFSHLRTRARFIAFMPQWDFLDFLAQQGKFYSTFHLTMRAEVTHLIEEKGTVVGLTAMTPEGPLEVRAPLVVGADGRNSRVRSLAGLPLCDLGAPMDVLWMRLSRKEGDPQQLLGRVDRGRIMVMIDRGSYWQCGYVIPKGGIEALQKEGLEALREKIGESVPFLRGRLGELGNWDDIKLLTVRVDRLTRWYREGLVCIGDAAHAMSPVGGVGINLAIQDAVAAAKILGPVLAQGKGVPVSHLKKIQRRREWSTRWTQALQVLIQNRVIRPVISNRSVPFNAPWPVKLFQTLPVLRRIPAYVIGIGFRPEQVGYKKSE